MQNLRIDKVNVIDNKTIIVTFTHNLVRNLNKTNVSIVSETLNVPDAEILGVDIVNEEFYITCTPLSQFAIYDLVFKSTQNRPFISINNTARLSEDGISNKYGIQGPMPEDNPVKQFLKSYYSGNIYDIDSGLISNYIDGLADILSQTLYDIGQVKNENYISHTIVDESKIRGAGPSDRLSEEGAYQLLRVARNPTGFSASKSILFDFFPFYPITLQGINNTESLVVNTINEDATFNKIDFILNLSKNPVTKLNSVRFIMNNSNQIYDYSIETLGYQILDSRYDQEFGFTYHQINDNQIKLSDKLLEDPNFIIDDILSVTVGYQYKNLGIVPDGNSVIVSTTKNQIREVLPPIINIFNLEHNNIVDNVGNEIKLGGITFYDPNSNNINSVHPAFTKEIEFKLSLLPSLPGQYSIDYASGTVYVYGSDFTNDGTGPSPPLATYYYTYTYSLEQDYVYDENFVDLVSLPTGVLRDEPGIVTFSYEEALIPDIDYKASLHKEELDERIDNRLAALNILKVLNGPVTNVFRIYNETSGEVYVIDRWYKDRIYFNYTIPPKTISYTQDRASFENVSNELLFVNTSFINSNSIKIFKILLNNNEIISSTEDGLGYFLNTSLVFSNKEVFVNERWFNYLEDYNISTDNITDEGEYVVDYKNGIIYVGVSSIQDNDIGVVNYKKNSIIPLNDHLLSVENIYYQTSPLNNIDKTFSYVEFLDNSIVVDGLEHMDEQNRNSVQAASYFVYNNYVGVFEGITFYPGVTYNIKNVRFVGEYSDVFNSINPLNFAQYSTFDGSDIRINAINKQTYESINYTLADGYYITLNENVQYISSNITYTFSIIRPSTNEELWSLSGTIEAGNQLKLILPGTNNPVEGEVVYITYSFVINNSSNVIIDYNRGELYSDYTYLNDEIIVSYEYGDNVIDFRESVTITEGEEYFITYRVGALRDALLKNFGRLIDVPELTNFDINFERERYRDAVFAGLSSFVQGPTITAIKNIGKVISHIEPIVSESLFDGWSLGNSLLSPSDIKTTGTLEFPTGIFNNGLLIDKPDQTVTFPYYSNLRLEEGTFESWIIPNWNGLSNDAELTFQILKDGVNVSSTDIFIGMLEEHPEIKDNKFKVSLMADIGEPNLNKDGLYIYCVEDESKLFNKWRVSIIDGYSSATSTYSIKILSSGSFYNFKKDNDYSDVNTFSSKNTINISLNPNENLINRSFSFISDLEKYLLDFGSGEHNKNRISLFKDVNGYFVFRVYDNLGKPFSLSYNVSEWTKFEQHHIAISWKFNTKNKADEMHLFIDGMEVPNIHKYGQKHTPYLYEDFRTISSEEILGLPARDILSSIDLVTINGSNIVTSSINFTDYNIQVGDTIIIKETWFDDNGYLITNINGQNLTLSSSMPISLSDARFVINRTSYIVDSFVNTASNVVVTRIPVYLTDSDLSGTINTNVVSSSIDFEDEDVLPGFLLRIDGYAPYNYPILNVSGNQLIIDGSLESTFTNTVFYIYGPNSEEIPGIRADRPSYYVETDGYNNDIIVFENNVYANDLLLINTLGLNSEIVSSKHYIWSDWLEHVIQTKMPAPISLDEVSIKKIILSKTKINSSNSTLISNRFESSQLVTTQPTNSQEGRTLTINISGANIDFTDPVEVIINGVSGIYTINESILFNGTDGYSKSTENLYHTVNWVKVNVTPLNINKSSAVVEIKEKYDITYSEDNGLVPEIKYSYHIGSGDTLYSNDGYVVTDDNNLFSHKDVGNYLLIHSPSVDEDGYALNVAGFYIINGISEDRHSLEIQSTTASSLEPIDIFTDGYYTILNVSDYRSGLQNGYFTFECSGMPSVPWLLPTGYYEFKYKTYARIQIAPSTGLAYLGSDNFGNNQINAVLDQVKIYSTMLTDTRVGETIPVNQRSITKDYNSLKELKIDQNTLMLLNFNSNINNIADKYIYNDKYKGIFYSNNIVNETFGNSVSILDKSINLSNDGILDTSKEGTIEFWVNPKYDTGNDPNERYYFDAFGAVVEEVISANNVSIKVSGSIEDVISIKLTSNNNSINYFDGARIEIDSERTIREAVQSTGDAILSVSKNILQVSTVKIDGDYTNTDYFKNGVVGSDRRTIYLGKALPQNNLNVIVTYQPAENQNDKLNKQIIRLNRKLPNHNTPVTVTYLPKNLRGDRLSIFKDQYGYINFLIKSKDNENIVRGPSLWVNNTWHRIKASYRVNTSNYSDEMRLWLDGYEYSNTTFNNDITVNQFPVIMGGSAVGDGYIVSGTISFKDAINNITIGSAFDGTKPIFSLIDNFRISNISRPIYSPYGESIDVNYNSNIDAVLPVTEDLYTTFLLDLNSNREKTEELAMLKNRETGLFNFLIKIIDSYGIIDSSEKSKEALEKLINILKPANTRAYIKYIS